MYMYSRSNDFLYRQIIYLHAFTCRFRQTIDAGLSDDMYEYLISIAVCFNVVTILQSFG